MAGMISDLVNILEEEANLLHQLYLLAGEKGDIIISNDTNKLRDMTAAENQVVGRIQRLQRERGALMKDIQKVTNQDSNLTIVGLSVLLEEEPIAETLDKHIHSIENTILLLKERNDQNRILLEHSLEYIDFSINMVQGSMASSPMIYSATGEPLGDEPGFLDIKN